MTNFSIKTNSEDPDQTAHKSDLDPQRLPERLLKHFSRREKQTTFAVIDALRVNSNK